MNKRKATLVAACLAAASLTLAQPFAEASVHGGISSAESTSAPPDESAAPASPAPTESAPASASPTPAATTLPSPEPSSTVSPAPLPDSGPNSPIPGVTEGLEIPPLLLTSPDNNDTRDTATLVQPGTQWNASLESTTDLDYYTFTASVSGTVTGKLSAVYPASSFLGMEVVDTSGLPVPFRIVGYQLDFPVEAQKTYYIKLYAKSPLQQAVPYGMELSEIVQDNNETQSTATILQPKTRVNATLEVAGDVDYYSFSPSASGILTAKLSAPYPAILSLAAEYTDASGQPVPVRVNGAQVEIYVEANTTYYFKLYAQSPLQQGLLYSLDLSAVYPDSHEFDDTPAAAVDMQLGIPYLANLWKSGDVDVFRFKAPVTGTIPIEWTVPEGKSYRLRVQDENGHLLAERLESSAGQAKLLLAVTANQTYLFFIDGISGSFGELPYTLRLLNPNETKRLEYHYNAAGRLESITVLPSGETYMEFQYDANGNLIHTKKYFILSL
ncbi:hypothetical protein [Gorillibacterium sp. sgz500922]|uniref:RHS repeat domain-containing protein n=1 Tax=Gorillibacterium sp. sgz500922 TaxID=3446694 RepID=UPI003F66E289